MTTPSTRRRITLAALLSGAAITAATGGVAYASTTDQFETVWATVTDSRGNPADTTGADPVPVPMDGSAGEGSPGSWTDCPEEDGSSGGSGTDGQSGSGAGNYSGSTDQREDV